MSQGERNRNAAFAIASAVLAVVMAGSFVEWALRAYSNTISESESMDDGFVLYDPVLGWKLNPGWSGQHHHFDFNVNYSVNEEGFRGPIPGRLTGDPDIFFVGDSFTFGLGVNDSETFVAALNRKHSEDTVRFSNLGVPGYAPDQSLLALEPILEFQPSSVIWVVYLGNDLLDIRYRFPLQATYGKPFFDLVGDRLALRNSPVPMVSKSTSFRPDSVQSAILRDFELYSAGRDALNEFQIGRRLNSLVGIDEPGLTQYLEKANEQDIQLFMAITSRAQALLRGAGVELEFVLMPGSGYFREGTVPGIYQQTLELQLSQALDRMDIRAVSLGPQLSKLYDQGQVLFHPNEGHLTAVGHSRVSEILDQAFSW